MNGYFSYMIFVVEIANYILLIGWVKWKLK